MLLDGFHIRGMSRSHRGLADYHGTPHALEDISKRFPPRKL